MQKMHTVGGGASLRTFLNASAALNSGYCQNVRAERGITLLEVMVAAAFLCVAMAGISTVLSATYKHSELLHEYELAESTALSVVEEVQYLADTSFSNLYVYFDADPSNDPEGPGTAPGDTFGNLTVPGLVASSDSPTGQLVEIIVHTNETEVNARLGLPRDLDGDGVADNPDVSASYKILPVTVRIHWAHQGAEQVNQMETLATKH